MKHSPVRIIATLAALGAMGAGAAWYVVSGNIVHGVQQVVSELNSKAHSDGSHLTIRYDSLARTGFPVTGARVTNPVFELDAPGDGDSVPPVHITWKRTGTFDIVSDYFTHTYQLVSDGSGAVALQSGTQSVGMTSAPARLTLAVQAKTHADFNSWTAMDWSNQAAVQQALKEVAAMHLAVGPLVMTDTASGAVIFSQDATALDIVNRSTDAMLDFDLAATFKGSLITKEYNDVITHAAAMFGMPAAVANTDMPFSAVRAGKQDMELALKASFPQSRPNGPMEHASIHLEKFSINNAYYQLSLPLDIVLDEKDRRREALVHLNWSANVAPAGAAEMAHALDMGAAFLPMLAPSNAPDTQALKEKITAALPTVSTLGPITLVLDLSASTPKPAEPGQPTAADMAERLNLRQFAFTHQRWGIEAKGDAWRDDKTPSTIALGLTCKRCNVLTQDVIATAQAAGEAMKIANPTSAPLPITDQTVAQLDAALADIGHKDDATGDITFAISTPQPGDVRVNDKPMAEVTPKLMAAFLPAAPSAPVQANPVSTPPVN